MAYHLLPHERWLAAWVLSLQQANPTPVALRQQQNYGPDGVTLLAAGRAGVGFAFIVGIVGIILVLASQASGTVGLRG
jgi:hypothetical protein